ncbi:fad binding domain-containing protein [Diaporthe amygdali]|uniref:fad binding domain-containing protein n=1 Tax=Phomopsis amygdali TaxID=1214568 RepID=UPI0022FE9DF1|nr:fad binding domain-containing protein [Diaporthe amygdali]KAJ0116619.1 fad binding domain-containing protein [Diaporthe amygdali]
MRSHKLTGQRLVLEGVTGKQFPIGTKDYPDWQYQYATTTHGLDHDMEPGLIIQPKNKKDIQLAVLFAKEQNKAIAIRTGGHQYSGASSTGKSNILLDLRDTFKASDDLAYFEKDDKSYVHASVSWSLGAFNAFLGKHKAFVPHGQCTAVHVGGHVQTGGYGQLGRSFGLFGDHIRSLEIIDHAGEEKEITRAGDPELFYAWLGGSPGNLGVLTHFTVEVHRDADYKGSMGVRVLHLYDEDKLKSLLQVLAEMNDDEEFPRNYDLCISVLSASFDILGLMGGLDNKMEEEHPEIFGEDGNPAWPRMIVVYAQYVPFSKDDKPDMTFFDRVRTGCWFQSGVKEKPMSELTAQWIFRNTREFDLPYVKRTYLTTSTELSTNGWVDWVAGRMDEIVRPVGNGQWLSAQLQCFGGKHSRFRTNADNGTSFSWRDSTLCFTIDSFHKPSKKDDAEQWAQTNDVQGIGPDGIFSKQDRRVLWGSYGSFDLDASWQFYYDDRAKYERLMEARKIADPDGTFTPNTFSVKRAD